MADPAPRSHVIAERYLTSPAALAASPYGPVDALDTHSGRGAQVRIVFAGPEWDEAGLADAVARWCGIGCSEVCGVLDFGRHGDRWFLVLPPSLGLPVERWRMLRRPTPDDAARLTLAFGRLAERVAAAGFSPDAASLADVAVGPGPTPFLERPLLQPQGRAVGTGDGQRVLAAVCAAALGSLEPPAALGAWVDRAHAAGFAGLPECLDELERCGVTAPGSGTGLSAAPPGLEHLFDDGFDLDGPAITPPREPRRPRVVGVSIVIMAIFAVLALLGHGARQGQASTSLAAAPPVTTPVVPVRVAPRNRPAAGTTTRQQRAARRWRAGHVRRRHRHRAARRAGAPAPGRSVTTPPAPPPPATTSTAATGAADGVTQLPAPGGTTLPAP
jgi:hypothetical protein